MNDLHERVRRLEENAIRMADLLERMAKSNADLVDLIKGIADALSPATNVKKPLIFGRDAIEDARIEARLDAIYEREERE
jgi:hypothetical protein